MFSFYGSKSKIIKKYPKPKYNIIIEPFAGSARYSLEHWENTIYLVEKDFKIYSVWNFLIESATQNGILSLPDVPNQTVLESIDGFSQLSNEEKWLIGFCCNGGSAQPKNKSGKYNFNSWNKDKIRIANNLHKVKHWKIYHSNYFEFNNPKENVTWFIDPPYINKGKWYIENKIDYSFLRWWISTLPGEVIVCENLNNGWIDVEPLAVIPFTHFKENEDYSKRTYEGIYHYFQDIKV